MFVCSFFLFSGVMLFPCVITRIMASRITKRSISTMEFKVFPNSNYFYNLIFIFVCFSDGTGGRRSRSIHLCGHGLSEVKKAE